MFWDLINFAMIGLLLGVLVRFVVATDRNRPPVAIFVTIIPGMIGSLLGGIASWYIWPAENGQFLIGGVLTAIVGGVIAVMLAVAVLRRSIG